MTIPAQFFIRKRMGSLYINLVSEQSAYTCILFFYILFFQKVYSTWCEDIGIKCSNSIYHSRCGCSVKDLDLSKSLKAACVNGLSFLFARLLTALPQTSSSGSNTKTDFDSASNEGGDLKCLIRPVVLCDISFEIQQWLQMTLQLNFTGLNLHRDTRFICLQYGGYIIDRDVCRQFLTGLYKPLSTSSVSYSSTYSFFNSSCQISIAPKNNNIRSGTILDKYQTFLNSSVDTITNLCTTAAGAKDTEACCVFNSACT